MSDIGIIQKALDALKIAEHPVRDCAKWAASGAAPSDLKGGMGSSPYYYPRPSEVCTCGIDDAITCLETRLK